MRELNRDMKAQNEIRAMNKDLLKHTVGWVQLKSTTETKGRTNVLDLDKLSTYGQDDLPLSVPAVKEILAVLGPLNHSPLEVLKYLY
jgi:hypothetical protein